MKSLKSKAQTLKLIIFCLAGMSSGAEGATLFSGFPRTSGYAPDGSDILLIDTNMANGQPKTATITVSNLFGQASGVNASFARVSGDGSGLKNILARGLLLPDRPTLFVDPTNGSDGNIGWMITSPLRTITNAVTQSTNGSAIFLQPGFWDLGTNNIILKTNTWLWGSGTNASIVFGFADLANVVGAQIIPRDNCWVNNLQIRCDTNSLSAVAGVNHSGTWSGVGFTQDAQLPYKNISATNWTVSNVYIRDGWFDCVHINQNLPWSCYCYNVVCDAVHGFNFLSQNGSDYRSHAVLDHCTVYIHDDAPFNITNNFAVWRPGFLNTDTLIEVKDCYGEVKTNGNGAISQLGFPPQMFILTPDNSANARPSVYVKGGTFRNPNVADPSDFSSQSAVFGYCNYNGTNVFKYYNAPSGVGASAPSLWGPLAANLVLVTNAVNTGVGVCGLLNRTNLGGAITLGGFSGLQNDKWNTVIWLAQNSSGANRVVTYPANCFSQDGVHSTTVTNNQSKIITFGILPGVFTNANSSPCY